MKKRDRTKLREAVKCLNCGKVYREKPFPKVCGLCPGELKLFACWTNGEPRDMSFAHPERQKIARGWTSRAHGHRRFTRTHQEPPHYARYQAEKEVRRLARKKARGRL